jgi:hypothetical protein
MTDEYMETDVTLVQYRNQGGGRDIHRVGKDRGDTE